MNRPEFQYEPLIHTEKSIRLLTVLRELSEDGLIRCEIAHANLSWASYSCLSYRWGWKAHTTSILLNDSRIEVQQNLWAFLDVARHNYPGRSLWIDALSIDQLNDEEQAHQVQHMGQIYSGAREVLVWLGPGNIPFETSRKPTWSPLLSHRQREAGLTRLERFKEVIKDSSTAKGEMESLYDNEYWSRAWIVQEVLLARELVILRGEQELSWKEFVEFFEPTYSPYREMTRNIRDAMKPTFRTQYPSSKFFGKAMTSEDVADDEALWTTKPRYRTPHQGTTSSRIHSNPLRELLEEHLGLKCERFHDRIYSLLGLAVEGSTFVVDYQLSRPSLLLHTLKECPDSCICMMHVVTRALYSERGESDFDDPGLCHKNLGIEIIMKPRRELRSYVEDATLKVAAVFRIEECSSMPCTALVTAVGNVQHDGWECISIEGAGKSDRYGVQWITNVRTEIIGNPCQGEWRLRLSDGAFAQLAVCAGAERPHECRSSEINAAYRFIEFELAGQSTASRRLVEIDASSSPKKSDYYRPHGDNMERVLDLRHVPYLRSRSPSLQQEQRLSESGEEQYRTVRDVFICKDISTDGSGSGCKTCSNRHVYGTPHHAVAHLRRAHFNPGRKRRGRRMKTSAEGDSKEKWEMPSFGELLHFVQMMYEVSVHGRVVEILEKPPEDYKDLVKKQENRPRYCYVEVEFDRAVTPESYVDPRSEYFSSFSTSGGYQRTNLPDRSRNMQPRGWN